MLHRRSRGDPEMVSCDASYVSWMLTHIIYDEPSDIFRIADCIWHLAYQKWLRKSEQGDKWNRCLIEGMIVLSETGARDEQTTPP